MNPKIQQIRQLCKEKGYALNRRWTIKTEHYQILNSRLGGWGEMVISIYDGKLTHCGKFDDAMLDKVIEELKSL